MNDTKKTMPAAASRTAGKLLNVVPMLLLFSLGFVFGMTYNFPNFYLPFVAPLPSSPAPSPPPAAPSPPPPPPSPTTNPQAGPIRFLAPSTVTHNMTDEELLWWASMTPKVQSSPYHRVPKVAFLFLARGDLPLRAAAAVGEVLRGARGALLHLRAHRSLLHRLAAGGLRLLRPHDP